MLRTIALGKAARLAATCVCPVVGTGVVTMTVPPLRHAVHHITAPHERALPKTRVRPVSVAPCAPGVSPAIAAIAPAAPVLPADETPLAGLAPASDIASLTPASFAPGTPLSGVPVDLVYPGTSGGSTPAPPVPLPETRTWMQLAVGFGFIGGGVRLARARLAART